MYFVAFCTILYSQACLSPFYGPWSVFCCILHNFALEGRHVTSFIDHPRMYDIGVVMSNSTRVAIEKHPTSCIEDLTCIGIGVMHNGTMGDTMALHSSALNNGGLALPRSAKTPALSLPATAAWDGTHNHLIFIVVCCMAIKMGRGTAPQICTIVSQCKSALVPLAPCKNFLWRLVIPILFWGNSYAFGPR